MNNKEQIIKLWEDNGWYYNETENDGIYFIGWEYGDYCVIIFNLDKKHYRCSSGYEAGADYSGGVRAEEHNLIHKTLELLGWLE